MVAPLRLAACLAIAVVLGAGCGGSLARMPSRGRAVGAIHLEGGRAGDAGRVVPGLGLALARASGQPYARFLVAQDQRRIASYYVRRGYFAATVATAIARGADAVDVTFTVVPGERAHLVRVDVLGLPPGAEALAAKLRALVPIADGAPFDHATWEAAGPTLPEALHADGYARATVAGLVLADRDRAEAVIRLDVTLGSRSRFGAIEVRGVPDGLGDAVAARLQVRRGEPYRPAALEETRTALYEMGRFALVRVEPGRDGDGDEVPVTVTVDQAARHDLRLGGGLGLNDLALEVHGVGQYGVAAWPTPLTTTRLEFRPAVLVQRDDRTLAPKIEAGVTLDRLDFLLPRYGAAVEVGFRYQTVEAYAVYGPRTRLGVRTPNFAGVAQASVGWQLEYDSYTDLSKALTDDDAKRLGLLGHDRVGAFDQSLVLDLRDDRVAPRRGGYVEVRAEEGTVAAGGDGSYLRAVPDARGYLSLGSVTLAARARLGILVGDPPVTRRFFGGGANDQRGLPERQLAPFVTSASGTQVPYGGTAQASASIEVRTPLPRRPYGLSAVVFLDGGDVTEGWAQLDLGHLHWASGVGLRVPTPIGPARVDVGYRLNRAGAGEPRPGERFAFHLSVGEAF